MVSAEIAVGGVPVHDILAFVGAVCLSVFFARALLQLVRAVRLFVLPSPIKLTSYGKWAVVTGATDGIGKAYVEELARKGMNVLLISRSADKLSSCIAELQEGFPKVEFASLAVDFSGGAEIYDRVKEVTADLDIGVLINNVGMATGHPMYFDETPEEALWKIINVNVSSTVFMTRTILPGMLTRRRGIVVNVSSGADSISNSLHASYTGTKSFVKFFTRSLAAENKGRGVSFQCVAPAFVATNMTRLKKTSLFAPSPQQFVKQAVNTLGQTTRTHGYWPHSLQLVFLASLPDALSESYIRDLHIKYRSIALHKAAKEAAKKRD